MPKLAARLLAVLLGVELLLVIYFLVMLYLADSALDKNGLGDLSSWKKFNHQEVISFIGLAGIWSFICIVSTLTKSFRKSEVQAAIYLPPLCLAIGYFLLMLFQ